MVFDRLGILCPRLIFEEKEAQINSEENLCRNRAINTELHFLLLIFRFYGGPFAVTETKLKLESLYIYCT